MKQRLLTDEEEEALWKVSFREAEEDPERLLGALIFVAAKTFRLCGDELYKFDPTNNLAIKHESDKTVKITYSKPKNKKTRFKVTQVQTVAIDNHRGFYYWFQQYEAKKSSGSRGFWQHPLTLRERSTRPGEWYNKKKQLGKNYFNIMMREMFKKAALPEELTLKCVSKMMKRHWVSGPKVRRQILDKSTSRSPEIIRGFFIFAILQLTELFSPYF